jgi:hypothetical protein
MKYLKYLKESIISDKIDRLEDLIYDLKDHGLIVDVIKNNPSSFLLHDGPDYINSLTNHNWSGNKYVFIIIYKIKNKQLEKFNDDDLLIIEEFRKTLRSYKLERSISGGDGFFLYSILKRDLYNSNL